MAIHLKKGRLELCFTPLAKIDCKQILKYMLKVKSQIFLGSIRNIFIVLEWNIPSSNLKTIKKKKTLKKIAA